MSFGIQPCFKEQHYYPFHREKNTLWIDSHSGAVAADLDLHNSSVSKQCVDFDPPAMILGVEREEEDGLFIISSYSYLAIAVVGLFFWRDNTMIYRRRPRRSERKQIYIFMWGCKQKKHCFYVLAMRVVSLEKWMLV